MKHPGTITAQPLCAPPTPWLLRAAVTAGYLIALGLGACAQVSQAPGTGGSGGVHVGPPGSGGATGARAPTSGGTSTPRCRTSPAPTSSRPR